MRCLTIAAAIALLLIGCGKEYIIKDGEVYLKCWNESDGNYEIPVGGADAETFQTIDTDDNITIGKDKNHAYIDGGIVEHLDPNSIKCLGNYYYMDKESVYFFGFYDSLNNSEAVGANPKTIKVSDTYPWACDDKHIIYGQHVLETNGIGSFTPLSKDWAKTATKVFYHGKELATADAKTFKVIEGRGGEDKNRVYHEGY